MVCSLLASDHILSGNAHVAYPANGTDAPDDREYDSLELEHDIECFRLFYILHGFYVGAHCEGLGGKTSLSSSKVLSSVFILRDALRPVFYTSFYTTGHSEQMRRRKGAPMRYYWSKMHKMLLWREVALDEVSSW